MSSPNSVCLPGAETDLDIGCFGRVSKTSLDELNSCEVYFLPVYFLPPEAEGWGCIFNNMGEFNYVLVKPRK